jgi:hypothetical protein
MTDTLSAQGKPLREMADVVSHQVPRDIRSVYQTDVDVDRPKQRMRAKENI